MTATLAPPVPERTDPAPAASAGSPDAYAQGLLRAGARVREAAADPALTGAEPLLGGLSDDLASADPIRLARWVDVDLHSAFDAEMLIEAPELSLSRWHARLGHVNTVLLVLPLLVTWVGLRSASAAYAALVSQDPESATQPFFALWQTGFEGTAEPFGVVVAWMLGCLMLLVVGQLAARLVGQRIDVQAATVERKARHRLTGALLAASCALSASRQGLPAQLEQQLRESADLLQGSADETRKVLASLQRATTKAQGLIDAQLDVVARTPSAVDGATAALTDAASALDGTGRQMGTALDGIAAQLAAVDAGRKELGVTLAAAITVHGDAAAERLAVASDDARKAHDDLVAALGLVIEQATQSLAHDADQSASRFTAAHAQLAVTIDQLTAALREAERVHEFSAATTQSQVSILEEMLDRAQAIHDQIVPHAHTDDSDLDGQVTDARDEAA